LTAIAGLSRFTLLTFLAAPVLLSPARGGITPQEATAQLKASASAAVKTLKSQLQVAKKAFLADLQLYETSVDLGASVATETDTFFTECTNLQAAVNNAANQAMEAIGDGAVGALMNLSNGAPLDGVFPKDFYYGTGGAFDKARRDVRSAVEKLYKPLANRLHKTVKVLEKNGATLTVELRPPLYLDEYFFAENKFSFFGNRFGLDTIVAVNRNELDEDGRAWLGGTAYPSTNELSVTVVGGLNQDDNMSVMPVAERWTAALTDSGTLFRKGNYVASVKGADDVGRGDGATFSFR
jgi:hypothetical protein